MSLLAFLMMSAITLLFAALLIFAVVPLGMYRQAAFAVLKRNFVGYFINPTGYVFLALFVVLTSFAAFWPNGFFASNLANFDQLATYLPYIMLVIIPAITMSTWSEEKRQGTDELLLTLPTTDTDIILGKYFASIFIFTVALALSQLWNVFILILLTQGELDVQLLLTNYLGFWFMGVSMLAIGMVASFLTNNLTVGFILGALFNAPLVFLDSVDTAISQVSWSGFLSEWSLLGRYEPFGRGLISLPSIIYFLGIAVLAIDLCLILIGRRHWVGAANAWQRGLHYLVRSAMIAVAVVSLTFITQNTVLNRVRIDTSEGRLSSLTSETREILTRLAGEKRDDGEAAEPIRIEAFVGGEVPAEYAQVRSDLLNLLREFDALGGKRLQVTLHNGVEPFSVEAQLAAKRFDIQPRRVVTRSQGTIREEELIMGAVFTCGLERVVVPFFEHGMPVEYELIRSISTVAREKRRTIGIVQTDARFQGGQVQLNLFQAAPVPKQLIVTDFEKQYQVESVDPSQEITLWIDDPDAEGGKRRKYDALIVVQPSSLGPEQLDNVVRAIRGGVPTAIFEDPYPAMLKRYLPGTAEPKSVDPQMAMLGGGRPEPKGDMRALWDLLHIAPVARINQFGNRDPYVIWQSYNPYPQIDDFTGTPEFVFVRNLMTNVAEKDRDSGLTLSAFPQDPLDPAATVATASLEELLLPYPGAIRKAEGKTDLEFIPLVQTGFAGTLSSTDLIESQGTTPERGPEDAYYTLAVRIRTSKEAAERLASAEPTGTEGEGEGAAEESAAEPTAPIDVIYVADVDCLTSQVAGLTSQPQSEGMTLRWQNRIFALNLIDSLTGETEYVTVRGRGQQHRTLKEMEAKTDSELRQVRELVRTFEREQRSAIEAAKEKQDELRRTVNTQLEAMRRKRARGEDVDLVEMQVKENQLRQQEESSKVRLEVLEERLTRETAQRVREANNNTRLEIQRTQSWYKGISVGIPWIPLALIGMGVFAYRRLREREGISKSRLRT
ncbi:MAG TPA: Gldg family protein [Pirellulaceae bacterium]|nr:Gldg family protein [Pirellulaceae bacterium]